MKRKIANAVFGVLAGILTAPLAVIVWPVAVAIFLYNETEEGI